MDSVKIVDAAIAGDKESFMAAFNSAIADKVGDALEVKKVEVASSLITVPETEVEIDEPTNVETEIEGSVDGESTDSNEVVDEVETSSAS